jgi:hypothetical protein
VSEPGKKGPTPTYDVSSNELIQIRSITAIAHLIEPCGQDPPVTSGSSSGFLQCSCCAAPATGFGNLPSLAGRYAEGGGADMHHLPFCPSRYQAKLCDTSTNQRNTRSVWGTFRD